MQKIFLLFLFFFTGCSKVTYKTANPHGEVHTQREIFFLYGYFGETTVDVHKLCPQGAAYIQQRITGVDAAIQMVTLMLVNPITIEVRCNKTGAAALPMDSDIFASTETIISSEVHND